MQLTQIPRRKLPRKRIVRREPYILEACRGKRVLHIGCTDALLSETRFHQGALLHQRLGAVTTSLAGVDIDKESVQWLTRKGLTNLFVGDVTDRENFPLILRQIGFEPQVIIAGEIVEHLSNPLEFLVGIQQVMRLDTRLIISVPNAFWAEGFVHVLLGREKVNPEHVAYYSWSTILELLGRASLEPIEIAPCRYEPPSLTARLTEVIQAPLTWMAPHMAPGYVVTATAAVIRPSSPSS